MATYPCSILLLALVLFATTSVQLAHGIVITGSVNNVTLVTVNGHLYCTKNGNIAPNARGVANATVFVSCDGGRTRLGQAQTDPFGFVNLVITSGSNGTALVLDLSKCFAYVKLPVPGCAALPRTGTLRANLNILSLFPFLNGILAFLGLGLFGLV